MRGGWNDKRFVFNTMTVNRKYLPLKWRKTENSSLFNDQNLFPFYILQRLSICIVISNNVNVNNPNLITLVCSILIPICPRETLLVTGEF